MPSEPEDYYVDYAPISGQPFDDAKTIVAGRFTNFPTGYATLKAEHRTHLLVDFAVKINQRENPTWVVIYGYASRRGNANANKVLSQKRIDAVKEQLSLYTSKANYRTAIAYGEDESVGGSENWGYYRSVDMYLCENPPPEVLPPPPPHLLPKPKYCPGGERYYDWSIAMPTGFAAGVVATVAVNLVALRCDNTLEKRMYVVPMFGPGATISIPIGKIVGKVLETIIGGLSWSGMSWTNWTVSEEPFNFYDIEKYAELSTVGANIGLVVGYAGANVSISGKLWYKERSGGCMFGTKDYMPSTFIFGESIQVGAGGGLLAGPFYRVKFLERW